MDLEQLLAKHGFTPLMHAKGGMSVVYRAQSKKSGEQLAIKFAFVSDTPVVLQKEYGANLPLRGLQRVHVDYTSGGVVFISPSENLTFKSQLDDKGLALQRLIYERDTLRRLKIHKVDEAVRYRGQQFFLAGNYLLSALYMEYIQEGAPLSKWLDSPMDKKVKYKIIHNLGKALERLQGQRVMHRDLKPEHVIVNPDLSIRILDFGLSSVERYVPLPGDPEDVAVLLSEEIRQKGFFRGTLGYVPADELLSGCSTSAFDIFSYGMIAYETLTGNPPKQLGIKPQIEALWMTMCYNNDERQNLLGELYRQLCPEPLVMALGEAIHPIPEDRKYKPLMDVTGSLCGEQPYELTSPPDIVDPIAPTIEHRYQKFARLHEASLKP